MIKLVFCLKYSDGTITLYINNTKASKIIGIATYFPTAYFCPPIIRTNSGEIDITPIAIMRKK